MISIIRKYSSFVLVALPLCGTLAVGGRVLADETVQLAFAWPDDLRGKVDFASRQARTVDGRTQAVAMGGRYEFVTSETADGLLVRFENFETEVDGGGSGPQAMVRRYIAKAASTPPAYVVSPEGRFVRVEGLEAFRGAILEGIDDAFAEFPAEARAQIAQALGRMLTREQIEANLVSEWNMVVGAWLGAELDQGDLYELSFNQAIPMFGNIEVPMRTTFLFEGRSACNDADSGSNCVVLEMRSFIDSDRFAAALETFLQRLPAGSATPRVEDLRQDVTVRLVSDPDTLLPHELQTTKRTETTVSVDGERSVSSQVEESRYVYSY